MNSSEVVVMADVVDRSLNEFKSQNWLKLEVLSFDEKQELLVDIVDDLLKEDGDILKTATRKIAIYYDVTEEVVRYYLTGSKYDIPNPVVAYMKTPDKFGSYEVKNSLFTHMSFFAINKFIYNLMLKNPEMTIIQAATFFIYYFDYNPPANIINIVGHAIRSGLKTRQFSGLFRQSLTKCSSDAAKFIDKI